MTDEIVRKLQILLRSPIDEEYKVVYLLTQTRKLFERDANLEQQFPTLQFYCNWALHTRLDRRPTAQFLAKVGTILTLEGNHDQQKQDELNKLFTLRTFRDELGKFFAQFDIRSTLCDNDEHWKAFLTFYSSVVEKCEVAVRNPAAPSGPLNLSVLSVAIEPASFAENKPYPMDWTVSYTDGRHGRLKLSEQGLLGATVDLFR